MGKNKTATTVEARLFSRVTANRCLDGNMKNTSRKLYLIMCYYTTDRLDL